MGWSSVSSLTWDPLGILYTSFLYTEVSTCVGRRVVRGGLWGKGCEGRVVGGGEG